MFLVCVCTRQSAAVGLQALCAANHQIKRFLNELQLLFANPPYLLISLFLPYLESIRQATQHFVLDKHAESLSLVFEAYSILHTFTKFSDVLSFS